MDELVVADVDAHMAHMLAGVGEEHQITRLQLAAPDSEPTVIAILALTGSIGISAYGDCRIGCRRYS